MSVPDIKKAKQSVRGRVYLERAYYWKDDCVSDLGRLISGGAYCIICWEFTPFLSLFFRNVEYLL